MASIAWTEKQNSLDLSSRTWTLLMSDPLLGRATAADRGTDADGEISKVIEFRLSGNLTGGRDCREKEREGRTF